MHLSNCGINWMYHRKELTNSVCLNHCSMTNCTLTQYSKLANTFCLLYSLVKSWKTKIHISNLHNKEWLHKSHINEKIYPLKTQWISWHIVSALFTQRENGLWPPRRARKLSSKGIQEYARGCRTFICASTRKESAWLRRSAKKSWETPNGRLRRPSSLAPCIGGMETPLMRYSGK